MAKDPDLTPPDGSYTPVIRLTPGSGLLRLIATSDLHAQLLSYDYFANRPLRGSGLSQLACLIEEARLGAPASILLDNGDFMQGGALAEIPATHRPHPAITAFNTLGYDAAALGNHEFDYGLERLREVIAAAGFPVLSANIVEERGLTPLGDHHFAAPATLIRRRIAMPDGSAPEITIGIFGLTPTRTAQWNARQIEGRLSIRDMEGTARAWVPELRRRGADLVICLAHTGIAQSSCPGEDDARASAIATIPGIDAVIAGHSHLTFPAKRAYDDPQVNGESGHIAGTPVVQPGHEGSHLGIIDLWLRPAEPGWQVVKSEARLIHGPEAVAGMPALRIRDASAPLRDALAPDHAAALSRMRQRLGTGTGPLSTWFANVSDSQALRLVGAAIAGHTRQRLEKCPLAGLPVVALVSAFRSGGRGGPLNYVDIPAGPISLRHVFSLYPFPNTLTAILTTGAALAARLDRASAVFRQITPGQQDQLLIDPAIPGFSFETAFGTSCQIDLAAAPAHAASPHGIPLPLAGGRIRDLRIDGRPLAPDDPLVLVVNNYLAGDPLRPAGRVVLDEGTLCTDVIAGYIRDHKQILPDHRPGWRFAPMPGTTVLYDSGSGAVHRMESAAHLRPEPLGLMPSGFSRFRLHL